MANSRGVTVKTDSGRIRGFIQHVLQKNIRTFYGIPYAEPPLGDLRFAKPVPVSEWKGKKLSKQKPASCSQIDIGAVIRFNLTFKWNINPNSISEDCLYLNVWAPESGTDMATMVWIHGGGFFLGGSSLDVYDAKYLSSFANIIVVSINYRLGPLGFMFLNHSEVPGNMGLLDQHLALRWIHDNIRAFGGDPDRITIAGQSAGGSSVAYHLLSPLSRDLFSGAILQSGVSSSLSYHFSFANVQLMSETSIALADAVGCSNETMTARINCLRQVPRNILTQTVFGVSQGKGVIPVALSATVDGEFLTNSPEQAAIESELSVPILLGVTKDEGSLFPLFALPKLFPEANTFNCSTSQYEDAIDTLYSWKHTIIKKIIAESYSKWPHSTMENLRGLFDLTSDYFFTCPMLRFALTWQEKTEHVYMYQFLHRPEQSPYPEWFGVTHCDEIEYLFGFPFDETLQYTEEERNVSRTVINYFSNFIKFGDPNGYGNEDTEFWPEFTSDDRHYQKLGAHTSTAQDFRSDYCEIWEKLIPDVESELGTSCAAKNSNSGPITCLDVMGQIAFFIVILLIVVWGDIEH